MASRPARPAADAVEALRAVEGIHDMQLSALSLEEIYCALLNRKAER